MACWPMVPKPVLRLFHVWQNLVPAKPGSVVTSCGKGLNITTRQGDVIDKHTALSAELRAEVHRTLLFGGAALMSVAALLSVLLGTGIAHVLASGAVYLGIALGICIGLRLHLPHQRFGLANRISLLRGGLVAVLAGFLVSPHFDPATAWVAVGLALMAMVLDGLDGMAARRTAMESPLGARLDAELDGMLTLVLCVLAVSLGKVGVFVLLAGGMHYAFLLARVAGVLPEFDLPSSLRRQSVGVLSSLLLVVCIVPSLAGWMCHLAASIAVMGLATSFALDVFEIRRQIAGDDRMDVSLRSTMQR